MTTMLLSAVVRMYTDVQDFAKHTVNYVKLYTVESILAWDKN